jgi:hypothetical protein
MATLLHCFKQGHSCALCTCIFRGIYIPSQYTLHTYAPSFLLTVNVLEEGGGRGGGGMRGIWPVTIRAYLLRFISAAEKLSPHLPDSL